MHTPSTFAAFFPFLKKVKKQGKGKLPSFKFHLHFSPTPRVTGANRPSLVESSCTSAWGILWAPCRGRQGWGWGLGRSPGGRRGVWGGVGLGARGSTRAAAAAPGLQSSAAFLQLFCRRGRVFPSRPRCGRAPADRNLLAPGAFQRLARPQLPARAPAGTAR